LAGVWASGASKKIWDPLRIFATFKGSNFKFGTQIGFGTSLPKNNVLDQNWRGSGPGEHPKEIWVPLRIFATVEASNFKCVTQIGFGTSLPEYNVLDQNWRGSGPGTIQKKIGTPYVFLQPLKPATSNLVDKLGLGLAYQKQRFGPKLAGVCTNGASKKSWDPLPIFATVEASD